jgi:predicted NAD/FAD-binding protein
MRLSGRRDNRSLRFHVRDIDEDRDRRHRRLRPRRCPPLHREHELVVYEAGRRPGGHANTVAVEASGETHWIDTGFIVFNDRNYPSFERLLDELGVATHPSRMSFSVSDGRGGFEYAGTPCGLFARPAHLASPAFLGMLLNGVASTARRAR